MNGIPSLDDNSHRVRNIVLFTGGLIILATLFVIDISTGSSAFGFSEISAMILKSGNREWLPILMNFRVPRAITAIIAGIALSISGLQMQTIFRNPLAGPYVLGISSGASLGVAILIMGTSGSMLAYLAGLGNWAIATAAWFGSALVLLLIMVVSVRVRDIMTVLIMGIMFASAISAVVSIMQYFSSESMLKSFVIWTMGSLGNLSWPQIKVLGLSVTAGLTLGVAAIKKLDAMVLGEDYAMSVGLNIIPTRVIVFISTSILAGSVTAFCGPIAFIGIAVPHIARIIFRQSSHRVLLPGTMLTGAIILLCGDIISQLPGSDRILPINSVTALIGIPILIWIIVRRNSFISVS